MEIAPRAILVAYTDGLVERRGELLDVGTRAAAAGGASTRHPLLDQLVAGLARELPGEEHSDDTAIVGIQWRT